MLTLFPPQFLPILAEGNSQLFVFETTLPKLLPTQHLNVNDGVN